MFNSRRNTDAVTYITGLMIATSLNALYLVLLYGGEVSLLLYKGYSLPYSGVSFWSEVVALSVCLVLDVVRVALTMYSLSISKPVPLLMVLLLALPIALGYLYFMLWQAHIFTVEWVLYTIAFIGLGAHAYLSFMIRNL